MNILTDLKSSLDDPKFLHVLCEWGLLWGLAVSWLLVLLAQFLLKDRRAIIFSLVLMALSALLVMPIEHFRKKAAPIGTASSRSLHEQTRRRADHAWVFYSLSALAGAATFLGRTDKGASGKIVTAAVVLGGLAATTVALWLQLRETRIIYDFN